MAILNFKKDKRFKIILSDKSFKLHGKKKIQCRDSGLGLEWSENIPSKFFVLINMK